MWFISLKKTWRSTSKIFARLLTARILNVHIHQENFPWRRCNYSQWQIYFSSSLWLKISPAVFVISTERKSKQMELATKSLIQSISKFFFEIEFHFLRSLSGRKSSKYEMTHYSTLVKKISRRYFLPEIIWANGAPLAVVFHFNTSFTEMATTSKTDLKSCVFLCCSFQNNVRMKFIFSLNNLQMISAPILINL